MIDFNVQYKVASAAFFIDFPAPEEAKTYGEYVRLFRSRNPGVDFKEACALRESLIGNHRAYFDSCWQQHEAEMIHAIYSGAVNV